MASGENLQAVINAIVECFATMAKSNSVILSPSMSPATCSGLIRSWGTFDWKYTNGKRLQRMILAIQCSLLLLSN